MPHSADLAAVVAKLAGHAVSKPLVGVVLGSGLGAFGDSLPQRFAFDELPGMPHARIPGHSGFLRFGHIDGVETACLQGRVHLYEGHPIESVVFGVRLLAALGCRAVLLTNAAGGIAAELAPGDRMLITDHLNLTGHNPLVGPRQESTGVPFIDLSEAYDRRLCELAHVASRQSNVSLKQGVYAGLLGPSYETPAEIRMLRTLGADAVGMSTVLEVIALRQLGIKVAAISCITNLAAGISPVPLDHEDVQSIARRSAAPFVALLSRWTSLVGKDLLA